MGPIPWHRIVEYARLYHLDDSVTDVFILVMRELDEAYLKQQRDNK